MTISEVNEKFHETKARLEQLRRATSIKGAKHDFSAFSSSAGSVHLYIEELIPDFPKPPKGVPQSPDLVWYQAAIGTPLMRLFRAVRNVNTHNKTITYVNRYQLALTSTMALRADFAVLTVRPGRRTIWRLLSATRINGLQRFRSWLWNIRFAVTSLLNRVNPKRTSSLQTWEAMFNYNAIQKGIVTRPKLTANEIALCEAHSVTDLCGQYVDALGTLITQAVARGLLR
jgi:hypothetical protein